MKHIRTIDGVIDELRRADPQCAITAYYLRILVKNGQIPSDKAGKKYLIAVEDVLDYFHIREGVK